MIVPLLKDMTEEQREAFEKIRDLGGIVADGEAYISVKHAAETNGLTVSALRNRLYRGWPIREALHRPLKPGPIACLETARSFLDRARYPHLYYKGKDYHTLQELSRRLSLNTTKLRQMYYVHNGDIDEAVEQSQKNPRGVEVTYQGKTYKSMAELSRETGIPYLKFIYGRKKGLSIDECAEAYFAKEAAKGSSSGFEYNGVIYKDLTSLALAHGLPSKRLKRLISEGLSAQQAADKCLSDYHEKLKPPIIYAGEEFPSVYAAVKRAGVDKRRVLWLLKNDYTVEDAINAVKAPPSPYGKSFTYNGKHYNSIAEFARLNDISYERILDYEVKYGLSVTEAIDKVYESLQRRTYIYKGIIYPSVKALAKELNISYQTLHRYVSTYQIDLESAVDLCLQSTPPSYPGKGMKCFGKEYVSTKQLAMDFGINPPTLYRHLSAGEDPEDAVRSILNNTRKGDYSTVSPGSTKLYCFGTVYASLTDLAMTFDLDWVELFDYMTLHQLSPKDAVIALIEKRGVRKYLDSKKDASHPEETERKTS